MTRYLSSTRSSTSHWIVIAGAIMSWLVRFGVVNVRNQFIRWSSICSTAHRADAAADPPLLPNSGGVDISPSCCCCSPVFVAACVLRVASAGACAIRHSCAAPIGRDDRAARPAARPTHRARLQRRHLKAAVTAPAEDGKANAPSSSCWPRAGGCRSRLSP
jgi:hypothetical protein